VVQKKTPETDGYSALQLGFGERKRINKPMAGHVKASGGGKFEVLKEFPVDSPDQYEVGARIEGDLFTVGEKIKITGLSKGRGFTGVMKRWGFHGGRSTHGCTVHRLPGSIGSATYPGRVYPGHKMAGRMGVDQITVRNIEVIDVRLDYGVILVKGAVPGPNQGIVFLKKLK
jgi:large subunit ribosomal protein L3